MIEQVFYNEWSGGGFDGQHIELEIVSPSIWTHQHAASLHYHKSLKNDVTFVCWTYQLHNEVQAQQLLNCWALACAYTMETGAACPALFNGMFEKYIIDMSKNHKFTLV